MFLRSGEVRGAEGMLIAEHIREIQRNVILFIVTWLVFGSDKMRVLKCPRTLKFLLMSRARYKSTPLLFFLTKNTVKKYQFPLAGRKIAIKALNL